MDPTRAVAKTGVHITRMISRTSPPERGKEARRCPRPPFFHQARRIPLASSPSSGRPAPFYFFMRDLMRIPSTAKTTEAQKIDTAPSWWPKRRQERTIESTCLVVIIMEKMTGPKRLIV